jgi:hypothetical protein
MGKDTPDWAGIYNNQYVYVLNDMGELAARLGSVYAYDRRGAVLWQTDFSHGLGDVTIPAGLLHGNVALVGEGCFSAPFCAQLTADGHSGGLIYLYKTLPPLRRSAIGMSCIFQPNAFVDQLTLEVDYFTGTQRLRGQLVFDYVNSRVYITDSAGIYDITASIPLPTLEYFYTFAKIVIDPTTGSYSRVVVNEVDLDLSAHALNAAVSVVTAQLRLWIQLDQLSTSLDSIVLLDNIVFTYAEP